MNNGITPSEKYLASLAQKSFLSLWSYSNVYYEKGKELADLLVLCGNTVVIFQDKQSEFPKGDVDKAWGKWFRRTIHNGSRQLWGAERVMKGENPTLYVDSACSKKLPIPLPNLKEASFHLVVVTHGGSEKCQNLYGGSGSFMLSNYMGGIENHIRPFTVGDIDSNKTFIHVLDDTSLQILMKTLDTVTDFSSYLNKRERLLRSELKIFSAGEEELLSNYLRNINTENEHDFEFGISKDKEVDSVFLPEGSWASFSRNSQRLAQIEKDKVSYMWDRLIESFSHHILNGTSYIDPDFESFGGMDSVEQIIRFMAMEPRFGRRVLATQLEDMIKNTLPTQRRIKVGPSFISKDTYYVFLLFPLSKLDESYDIYRKNRVYYLWGVCMVAKTKFPDAKHIVGIASEPYEESKGSSEDALYLNVEQWTQDQQAAAVEFQQEFKVLVSPKYIRLDEEEYPDI